jgi:hypothetical protein
MIAIAAALVIALPRVGAEKTPILILDDASPTADVTITLDNGAPGAVYLELQGVALSLRDESGADLLIAADPRVTALGIQIAQDSPVETLHLERVAGVSVAQAHVVAQATLPDAALNVPAADANAPLPVLAGPASTTLDLAPVATLPIFVDQTNNRISLSVSNGQPLAQIIDRTGAVVLSVRTGGATTSLMVQLAEGQYALIAANPDRRAVSSAHVTLSAGQPNSLPNAAAFEPAAAPVPACQTLILNASTVHSGPGTAYSSVGAVSSGDRLAVGGVNREGGWMLVQSSVDSGWLSADAGVLSGNCANLSIYDIPVRNSTLQALRTAPDGTRQQGSVWGEEGNDDEREGGYDD